ncbi:MAG: TolC family protein, partial [Candidatus Sulfotelmatobacter sp.]
MSSIAARVFRMSVIYGACAILPAGVLAQTQTPAGLADAPAPAKPATVALQFDMPKSHNPLKAYASDTVPEPTLANSPHIDQNVRDGKLYLSLKDAIELALEDNLDLAIARYNLPIANTDIVRTQAGGFFRGVNTGVVQG